MNTNFSSMLFLFYFATAPVCCIVCNDKAPCSIQLQSKLYPDVFSILSHPDKVTRFKTRAEGPTKYVISGKEEDLSTEDLKSLQTVLLDDKNYDWLNSKRCVFMPESGLRFRKGEQEVVALFSLSGNQVKFEYQSKTLLLDYDQIADLINKLMK